MPSWSTVCWKESSVRGRVAMSHLSPGAATCHGRSPGSRHRWEHAVNSGHSDALEHLDPVAGAVVGVEPDVALEAVPFGVVDEEARGHDGARDGVEVVHHEGRMGPAGGREPILDPDMDLRRDRAPRVVRAEPGASPTLQRDRLLDLGEPEALPVEATRVGLATGRAGDLDVVERDHAALLEPVELVGTCATTKIRRKGRT